MIDHTTRYSVSCVISSTKKEPIVKKTFRTGFGLFGQSKEILEDNGRESAIENSKLYQNFF